ncbi:MAG: oligosaccharide flippase family protein, partial [Anaeroplasmataceae bacterium]|nr:oligosaccharide flippase family protein [Anaeroplasmataceae bacterium]
MATSEQILLEVEEKKYILNFIELGALILSFTIRILAVVYWKNYYIYACAILVKNLLTIAIVTIISRKKYSNLFSRDKINEEDKKYIKKNLFDLIPMRLANFLYSSTDSVIISSLIGISVLAVFSNYNLIFVSVLSFILISVEIIKIPFGKMFEEKNPNIEKYMFSYFLFQFFLSSICALCLLNLTDDFITLFFGEGLLLEKYILIIFVVDFFIHSIYQPFSMVILSKGLFKTEKWITLIVEGVNVVVSIVLVLWIGVGGAIIGTLLSNTISLFIRIHRVGFKFFEQKKRLVILFVSFFVLVSLEGCLSYYLVSSFSVSYLNLFIKLLISVSVPTVINLLIFFKTKEFK